MGADANDGFAAPVKRLKRAFELAFADGRIKTIELAVGRYGASNGEAYPYLVPAGLIIRGPTGGGAILVGTKETPGLTLETGWLQNLEFEDFTIAISSTGVGQLSNVHVRSSSVALRGETGSKLTAGKLDITGSDGVCATGVQLVGDAVLTASDLQTHALAVHVDTQDQSVATFTAAHAVGRSGGMLICSDHLFVVRGKMINVENSLLEGGDFGVSFENGVTAATLKNTTVRNTSAAGIAGGPGTFIMTGGEVSSNWNGGVGASSGNWTFTNVKIIGNLGFGLAFSSNPVTTLAGGVVMRGTTVSANYIGIGIGNFSGDFGTVLESGNNTIQNNSNVGLSISNAMALTFNAVGNTWNSNVQGADAQGKYPRMLLSGPIEGSNITIWTTARLQL